ncbi:ABC transporter substrate-binding protein [Caldicoprobacter algeriensis]|uniref:ABC transporter substrate-binding protein n=1 Tax=Caldicoprobacter algeriensis TaxID=699281 RepID=UPI0020798C6D|nr:ABC transporter substrate-binding protein [Caldicoprobacter algeriensis]MCM8900696.1 ABC transporter substrate-binding protein [Caldicoprobacter algeriensis]
MVKKVSILLIVVMLISIALFGCAKTAVEPSDVGDSGSTNEDTTKTNDTEKSKEQPVELIWIMGNPGQVPADQAMVEEKLNEISVPLLNVKMKTLYYDNERTTLALASGEKWDIVFTCEWFNNFAVQARKGYFADITEKVKTLTPKLYESMPEIVWEGAKIDGKIMAVPVKKDYCYEMYYQFDKKLFVDALGMEIPKKMSFFDVEKYLKAAKQAYKDGIEAAADAQYPLKLKGQFVGLTRNFDIICNDAWLGIPYSAIGTADATKVVLMFEHPDLLERLKALHKWYKAGYINPDAPVAEDIGTYSAVKSNLGFYGADAIWSARDGYVQVISKFEGPFLSTTSIRGAMNAINAKSPHIDLALKYLELVNTNKEYRDILRYGIEGVHWNYTDKGLVLRTERGRQRYSPWAFAQGSYELSTPEAAEGVDVDPNMWKVIFEGYKNAIASEAIGFSFDITPVESQVAACKNVISKYSSGLLTGAVNPEVEVPKLIAELEAAGIRDIQKEAQRQLDEFLANKK